MGEFRQRYEHHLLLKVSAQDAAQTEAWLRDFFAAHEGGYFHCTAEEGRKAFLHRFAVAGAAVRYREVHRAQVQDIVALDIALRRDDADWFEQLPADLDGRLLHKLYYGHFLCHVFHQDYIARKGEDPMAIEHAMWALLDQRGAEYPAEHNVGHLYRPSRRWRGSTGSWTRAIRSTPVSARPRKRRAGVAATADDGEPSPCSAARPDRQQSSMPPRPGATGLRGYTEP